MNPKHTRPATAHRGVRLAATASALALVAASWPALAAPDKVRRIPLGGHISPARPFFDVQDTRKGAAPGRVLLVDDDDNFPDVRLFYTDVLDALVVDYDVWDTMNTDVMEPDAATLAAYGAVIWFSGAAFAATPPGVAGPGDAGEAALASFLDAGGCLLLSSQDYLLDHAGSGFTPFMTERLGLAGAVEDLGHDGVTGAGPFTGIGPSVLSFPFGNFSDALTPDMTAETAFFGDDNPLKIAALAKEEGTSRASFWGFPFEALPAADRELALAALFAWCAGNPTLEVTLAGSGSGTVTSSPAGIDCGTDCSEAYAPGTEVTLTATAGPDSAFTGWTGGGCSGTGPCVVFLDSATTVTATFDGNPALTVIRTGTGTGTVTSAPAGIDCGADCSETYPPGTEVTLTADPDAGSTFTGWTGGGCAGTGTCVVTLDSTTTVAADFAADEPDPTLTVTTIGSGSGTVTSSPAGIDCGADSSETYPPGTEVTLTANADAGSTFAGWSGGGCSGTGTCVVTLDDDTTVTAAFDAIGGEPATLTVTKTGLGAGTVTSSPAGIDCGTDCSSTYPQGIRVTLTATPASGSTFTDWSGGGCGGTGACEVTLDDDTTVTAAFAPEGPGLTLTVARTGTGTGTVTSSPAGIDCGLDCSATYSPGTQVTLTAAADPGSAFSGWSGGCGGSGLCVVTLDRAEAVSAIFAAVGPNPTLTVHRAGTGTGTVTSSPAGILCGTDCSQSYSPDTVVSLTALADPGSTFASWGGDCGGLTCTVSLSFFNQSVTAIFDEEPCPGAVCLNGDRFQVDVEWRTPQGQTGAGIPVPFRSDDSGLLWFFSEDNWEMLIKVLDGCSFTQHFWVFAAATTDVEYTLTVTDTVSGQSKSYFNPQGNAAASITDTSALAVCDAGGAAAPQRVHAVTPLRVTTGETAKQGDCTDDATRLCLNQSRFEVEADWQTVAGETGSAVVVPSGSDDSGIFYFFSENNWEMLVKVLDGCGINDRFWVFAAATTDVGYTLKVTDTETGQVREYVNPVGRAAPATTDTAAFATCPQGP